jgi:membrane fusion protein, multidrug efflux system
MNSTEAPQAPPKPNRRLFYIIICCLSFALLILLFFLYWHFYGQFYEYTDDAYVGGNAVSVTPLVEGNVQQIFVDETDMVSMGQLLLSLDPTDTVLALEEAEVRLASTLRDTIQLFEQLRIDQADVFSAQAAFQLAELKFKHREALLASEAIAEETFEEAFTELQTHLFQVQATQYRLLADRAKVMDTTVLTHPDVLYSMEKLRQAYLSFKRCQILAPVSGMIAKRAAQVGEHMILGQPVLSIVPLDQFWVDANSG